MPRMLALSVLILLLSGCYFPPPEIKDPIIERGIQRYGPVGSEVRISITNVQDHTVWVQFGDVDAEVSGRYAHGVTVVVPTGFITGTVRAKIVESGMEDDRAAWVEQLDSWERVGKFTATFLDDTPWLAVSTSRHHGCGIKADQSLWCWGETVLGGLGTARSERQDELIHPLIPVHLPGEWDAVSVPDYVWLANSCGRQTDGSIWCWGDNMYGPFPAATGEFVTEPTRLAGDWSDVKIGGALTCGRKEGELYCWTRAFEDHADLAYLAEPQQMGEGPWASYAVGYGHACGIKADDDSLWCWGMNDYGQLGDGTLDPSFSPVKVPGDVLWRMVEASGRYLDVDDGDKKVTRIYGRTCGITTDDDLYCWGATQSTPRAMEGSGWRDVDASLFDVCAIRGEGTVWCWGGKYPSSMTKQPYFDDWQAFSPNGQGAAGCGIRKDGSAWCIHDEEAVRIKEFVVSEAL